MPSNGPMVILLLQVASMAWLLALTLLLRSLRSYATKKGENLATKEDVAAITREVEEVKREDALCIFKARLRHIMGRRRAVQ